MLRIRTDESVVSVAIRSIRVSSWFALLAIDSNSLLKVLIEQKQHQAFHNTRRALASERLFVSGGDLR